MRALEVVGGAALEPEPEGYSGPERRRAAGAPRRESDRDLLRRLDLLEQELEQARHDLEAARAEVRRARGQAAAATHQLDRAKNTISYRLGAALLRMRTWRGLAAFPGAVAALVQDSRRRRTHSRQDPHFQRRWRELLAEAPVDAAAATAYVRAKGLSPSEAADLLADLAKGRRAYDLAGALDLGQAALAFDRAPARLRWMALLQFEAGMITAPAALAAEAIESGGAIDPAAIAKLEAVRGLARVQQGVSVPARRPATYAAEAGTLLYVAASSLPHHVSGYTTRTHNLCRAIRERGWDVRIVTRPGYPWDRRDSKDVEAGRLLYSVGDLTYERLRAPSAADTPLDDYLRHAADALYARLCESRASVVHAASNHLNGLPALMAARRAGVPFVYSVRGLWELTTAATKPGWEQTERFALQSRLETLVAKEADVVLTLTDGLKAELVARGVPADRIRLAPNCVDVEQFAPAPKDESLAMRLGLSGRCVVGFLGSLIDYEGLDHLLEATASAIASGADLGVLIVGDGPVAAQLQEQARQLGLSERVVMTGRVAPEAVPGYYSLVDIAAFPRKPFRVCEIVSPLKPLEAMAMGKAVVASDVGALAEMVRHDETGLLFRKGSSEALTEALVRLATTTALARRLGENGRAWVERERTWTWCASQVTGAYEDALARAAKC